MAETQSSPEGIDRCRQQLQLYISELKTSNLPWYESVSSRQHFYWNTCSFLSVVAGFAASIVAAFISEGAFKDYGKILLIVLPAIGSLAAALLTQFRFEEFEDLREVGRIEIQDMIDWASGQLAGANDEARCLEDYEELRKKVTDLETRQHRRAHEILRSPLKQR